jgi:hypothetical protein
MFSSAILRIRKYDEIFLKNFITDIENTCNTKINKNVTKLSNIKSIVIKICYLNKQLKELNNELKNDVSLANRNCNLTLCENLKRDIKILLDVINCNKLPHIKKHLLLKQQCEVNKLKRKQKEKCKEYILRKIYSEKKKNRLIINIDNWMKLKQNEIDEEKEKKKLHKNADIVLSDVRANRIDAKKFFLLLRELKNLRKIKVAIARKRGEVIAIEADEVFNNIIGTYI